MLDRITSHAVERYCHRVLGVTIYPPKDSTPRTRAELFCAAAGLVYDQIVALIDTPNIERACRLGIRRMHTDDFIAVIEDGRVVTVVERRRPKKVRARMREMVD